MSVLLQVSGCNIPMCTIIKSSFRWPRQSEELELYKTLWFRLKRIHLLHVLEPKWTKIYDGWWAVTVINFHSNDSKANFRKEYTLRRKICFAIKLKKKYRSCYGVSLIYEIWLYIMLKSMSVFEHCRWMNVLELSLINIAVRSLNEEY